MNVVDISEDFLHYIWKLQKFDQQDLVTTKGEEIQIVETGQHNLDSGPDFFGAQIRIGETLWAGNIEIHIKSSYWTQHGHHKDPSYNNVILHVVYEDDTEIKTSSGLTIPVLKLQDKIPKSIFDNYFRLQNSDCKIPCQEEICDVENIHIRSMMQKTAIERMENKTKDIARILKYTNNSWEECCYILLGRYFGVRVNKDPFERLCRSIPLNILKKHKNQLHQIEALLLGQSGLLPKSSKEKEAELWIQEYSFLSGKYGLQSLDPSIWKFSRMRPISFPTIRISQFAHLIFKQEFVFSKILASYSIQELYNIFDVNASAFWDDHYHFNKNSNHQVKKLGAGTKDLVCINVVAPLLFQYGISHDDDRAKTKAIELMESLKSENNKVIRQWKDLNIETENALDSQGLLELHLNYCTRNKCLDCIIGNRIIQK